MTIAPRVDILADKSPEYIARADARFRAKVALGSTEYEGTRCIVWIGAKNRGYGQLGFGKSAVVPAHRYIYERLVGPIPEGLTIDHLCFNPACVNTNHLEPTTQAINAQRSQAVNNPNREKTHCPYSHPYDEANTYRFGPGRRWRLCRICADRRKRAYKARKRAER